MLSLLEKHQLYQQEMSDAIRLRERKTIMIMN
jgi:hypothetical protein